MLGIKDHAPVRYVMQGYNVAETLKLKEIDRMFRGVSSEQSSTKLTYREGENGFYYIYRFGSVIFFNIDPERQRAIIEKIKMIIGHAPEMITSEEFYIDIKPGEKSSVGFDGAVFDILSSDRIEIISLVLAQSMALEFFETHVDEMLKWTGKIAGSLKDKGRLIQSSRKIKKYIGQCITAKQQLVASLYLLDKPDETWEVQVLDKLYYEAVDMFEIKDRYKTLDYKLRMIQENLELIANLLQYRHANYLEWAIIILIAIEIFFSIYEHFLKH
ncbi:MAG TPA: RMD1 family protein [bacterium]|nr:RMD1 family protein [Myxococcales bacterium]OQA60355.1 MAG: hypothetical protein BWY40_00996 [bacterium ADurb.Bin270]HPW45310.1 RMD1 family protein [bacterium]HQG13311.1 RMD1 family protein [bacterium]HQH80599.1 RMD1 family protein [bacterium]